MVLASHAVVAVWLTVNAVSQGGWRRAGIVAALLGWLLNLAVMLPNGGMPVSRAAMVEAGSVPADVTDGNLSKHVLLTDDTVLGALGDVHPLAPLRVVYSAGDVLLLAGLVVILGSVVFERDDESTAAACTPASLTSHRLRRSAETTSRADVPGSIGTRYSSSARPSTIGSSSTTAQ
jgi:hypothetical protein